MSVNEMLMAAAGQAGGAAEYVEDVFSTYLYTGTGATLSINNGIDLSGEGGLTWIKSRSARGNYLFDTERGAQKWLVSNETGAQETVSTSLTSFNNNGFSLGSTLSTNYTDEAMCSWTFRKQAKFFDVVTYTGNGTGSRAINHNLGSAPGMIIIKNTSGTADWAVWHRGDGTTWRSDLSLNTTGASANSGTTYSQTSTQIQLSQITTAGGSGVNDNGFTYVAYLFAHNAGGFGAAGTDNIISCGSMVTSTPLVNVNLGYEPQLVMWKRTDATGNWGIADNMRGMPVSGDDRVLIPNLSNAESLATRVAPNATGFTFDGGVADGSTFIYMAIRRPMKTPTSGTSVFAPVAAAAGSSTTITTNFSVDMVLLTDRSTSWVYNTTAEDRLRGGTIASITSSTNAERTDNASKFDSNVSFVDGWSNLSTRNIVYHAFRRATGFFDQVCYTGTGTTQTLTHNLGVVPELIIVKSRSVGGNWWTWAKPVTSPVSNWWINYSRLNGTNAFQDWGDTSGIYSAPTATTLTYGGYSEVNGSGNTFVTYLFASVAGVSKVGSYTGNGSNQTINCGFSAGARFVLIKRTDSTGDWCVFDTARGIVSGNDPFLQLNSTAVEVTGEDAVDPTNSGFIVNETTEALNTNNATYIYLAIA